MYKNPVLCDINSRAVEQGKMTPNRWTKATTNIWANQY